MALLKKTIHHAAVQSFMNDSVLMNWSNLNKSILVLVLGGLDHILWIAWYLSCSYSASLQKWMNPEYFTFHVTRMVICCVVCFLLILPCYFFKHYKCVQKYLPYISVNFFALTFIYGGYSIGIMSPATIAGYISLVTVGLVLFERKIVYSILIPVTIYLIASIMLSSSSSMTYAPVFSEELKNGVMYKNSFWVYSQMFLYIPIFFTSIFLFEILLTQWRNREKQINEMSQIDPLTGIYNRRKVGLTLNALQEDEESFAIVLLDLDHFKKINDNHGHDVGDQVLQRVAKILSMNLRDGDVVGRFGGEEFILILKQKTLGQAIVISERCRQEIEKSVVAVNKMINVKITASFGIAISGMDMSKEAIIRQADQALYFAKKSGRNQVRHYFDLALNTDHQMDKDISIL